VADQEPDGEAALLALESLQEGLGEIEALAYAATTLLQEVRLPAGRESQRFAYALAVLMDRAQRLCDEADTALDPSLERKES
jgi:ABC-type polar amino acid transport system ATPase subunit